MTETATTETVPVSGRRRYSDLLGRPHVLAVLVCSMVARMPLGMTPLALLLLVRSEGGSYGAAGAVVAAYTASLAVGAPIAGRMVDRLGQPRVLLPRALVFPSALVLATLLAVAGTSPWWIAVTAMGAGLAMPPIGASVRSLWSRMLSADQRATAYALEAALQEVHFLLGPLLVAVLAAVSPPLAVAAAAVLAGVGTLAFTRLEPVRGAGPAQGAGGHGLLGALRSPGVRTIVLLSLCAGTAFGASEVGLPAFAEEHGSRELGGVALAAFAAGSLVGGLLAGAHPGGAPRRRLQLFSVLLACGLALPLLADSIPALCILVFVAGISIAPLFAAAYRIIDAVAWPGTLAESFAWLGTALASGLAIGTAIGGIAIDERGVRAAFLLGVVGAGLGAVAVALRRRTLYAASGTG